MSIEQVNNFMEKIIHDKELQKKIISLPTDDMDGAIEQGVQIAKEAGFNFTKEHFLEYTNAQNNESELSDNDLEQVAGGAHCGYQTKVWLD